MAWSSVWQSYHSLPSYTWFTPLWLSFLCWQSLKKSYKHTHHNFCSKRWLEVLFDNHIILCHPTRGLSPFLHHFDHPFFADKVWRNPTNKLIIIFVLRFGLKFFLTIISFTAILHVVWAYFDTIMILLSCLNNFNQQTHLNFRSKRWLEVLFDNYIIHCHLTRGLLHFDHPFFAGKVWRNPTNKLIIIFVLRDGLKFFWTILPFWLLSLHMYIE